jgi:hypothetical protein
MVNIYILFTSKDSNINLKRNDSSGSLERRSEDNFFPVDLKNRKSNAGPIDRDHYHQYQ